MASPPRKVRTGDRPAPAVAVRRPIHVVCDNLRSAYNVGSFFRTCDAAAIERLYLCGICAAPPNEKLAKTALGTTETVPWEYAPATLPLVLRLQREGIPVIAAEMTDRSAGLWDVEFPSPVALVFGHERNGIDDEVLRACDGYVEIPTAGIKNSLNVATAIGIVLYEVLRQLEARESTS